MGGELGAVPESIKPCTNYASKVYRSGRVNSVISNNTATSACPGLSAD